VGDSGAEAEAAAAVVVVIRILKWKTSGQRGLRQAMEREGVVMPTMMVAWAAAPTLVLLVLPAHPVQVQVLVLVLVLVQPQAQQQARKQRWM
jgi:hypothetical protein